MTLQTDGSTEKKML